MGSSSDLKYLTLSEVIVTPPDAKCARKTQFLAYIMASQLFVTGSPFVPFHVITAQGMDVM